MAAGSVVQRPVTNKFGFLLEATGGTIVHRQDLVLTVDPKTLRTLARGSRLRNFDLLKKLRREEMLGHRFLLEAVMLGLCATIWSTLSAHGVTESIWHLFRAENTVCTPTPNGTAALLIGNMESLNAIEAKILTVSYRK